MRDMENKALLCPVCLGLSYDMFKMFPPHHDEVSNMQSQLRYHTVGFDDLNASATGGCRNCSILQQGVTLFWGTYPGITTTESRIDGQDEEELQEESVDDNSDDQEDEEDSENGEDDDDEEKTKTATTRTRSV